MNPYEGSRRERCWFESWRGCVQGTWVGGWVGGWVGLWEERGERGGSNELLWGLYGWAGGWREAGGLEWEWVGG